MEEFELLPVPLIDLLNVAVDGGEEDFIQRSAVYSIGSQMHFLKLLM